MSELRVIALIVAIACLGWLWLTLQRGGNTAINRFVIYPTAIGLAIAAIFPQAYQSVAAWAGLQSIPGGTLIFLLIIVCAVSWIWLILMSERLGQSEYLLGESIIATASDRFLDRHGSRSEASAPGMLVIIPALNEAENLADVLSRMPRHIGDHAVQALVVDDGSQDDTVAVSRNNGAWVASHPFSLGGGAAIRTGFSIAGKLNIGVCATMDGDGQHDPAELEALAGPVMAGKADMSVGSRILGGGETYSRLRLLGVHLFSLLLRLLIGQPVTDAASGYRVFNTRRVGELRLTAMQYHTAETIILAAKHGLRITEGPVTIARRASGESRKGNDFSYSLKFFASVVRAWWR